jgi:large-conductance mechanosensitive channel
MEWLRRLDENPLTERVIMALILVNAVTLGFETSGGAMERYGPLLIAIDRIAIAIFVVEILARLIVQRAAFFSDGWNIFGEEHAQNESKERKAERKIMHEETAPLLREIRSLRAEIASLREDVAGGKRRS